MKPSGHVTCSSGVRALALVEESEESTMYGGGGFDMGGGGFGGGFDAGGQFGGAVSAPRAAPASHATGPLMLHRAALTRRGVQDHIAPPLTSESPAHPQDQFGGAAFGAPQSFSQQNAGGFQVDNSTPDGKVR